MKCFLHVMIFIALLSLSGCSVKHEITTSHTYLITIKTPQMALSDTGFLNQGTGYTQLQIFNAGSVLFNLEMNDTICLDGTCLEKEDFNRRFFGTEHYATLMEDIVSKKALYEGKNRVSLPLGFTQKIDLPTAHIEYHVEGDMRYFKDSKNGVLIRLRPLP